MEAIAPLIGILVFLSLLVGVPLSILRSLDEVKQGQRRIESRLEALEARWRGYGADG